MGRDSGDTSGGARTEGRKGVPRVEFCPPTGLHSEKDRRAGMGAVSEALKGGHVGERHLTPKQSRLCQRVRGGTVGEREAA